MVITGSKSLHKSEDCVEADNDWDVQAEFLVKATRIEVDHSTKMLQPKHKDIHNKTKKPLIIITYTEESYTF